MYGLSFIFERNMRNIGKSILTIIFTCCLVLFVGIYADNILKTKSSLAKLSKTSSITAQVTDISGTKQQPLQIPAARVDSLLASDNVKNPVYTGQVVANYEKVNQVEHPKEFDTIIKGAFGIEAFASLSKKDLHFQGKWNESFLSGKKPLCLLNDSYARKHNIQPGQEMSLPLYSIDYQDDGQHFTPIDIGTARLTVIGTYPDSRLSETDVHMIVPIGWLRDFVQKSGKTFSYASMNFTIKHPAKLNAFKREMKRDTFSEADFTKQPAVYGGTLVVSDQLFIQNATKLRQNLETFQKFLPPFAVLIALLLVMATFLLLKSKRLEAAIASSLGQPRGSIALGLFWETAVLQLLACIIGFLILLCITAIPVTYLIGLILMFAVLSCISSWIALWMLLRFDVVTMLTSTE